MGEYINHKGTIVKIGTCEDLLRFTFVQLREMVAEASHVTGNALPEDYINLNIPWRYRFPFRHDPEPGNLDYSVPVTAKRRMAEALEHGRCHARLGPPSPWTGYGINAMVPCPNASFANPGNYHAGAIGPDTAHLMVRAVGWRDGGWHVIVACPYCGALSALDRREAEEIAALNEHNQHMPPADLLAVYGWDETGTPATPERT